MANEKILVVDDDVNICELLRLYLEKEGYTVSIVNDGESAVKSFGEIQPDLMLLDIMLPRLDGWQVCREIRKFSDKPIIMLTAKGETFDKVLGLELGADDYVVKPFGMLALLARVQALLRRVQEPEDEIAVGGIGVLKSKHRVKVDNAEVELTRKEYELLLFFMDNIGKVYSRQDLLNRVWGYAFNGESRTVDAHIRALRQKLGESGDCIETVRGVGYRMREEEQ